MPGRERRGGLLRDEWEGEAAILERECQWVIVLLDEWCMSLGDLGEGSLPLRRGKKLVLVERLRAIFGRQRNKAWRSLTYNPLQVRGARFSKISSYATDDSTSQSSEYTGLLGALQSPRQEPPDESVLDHSSPYEYASNKYFFAALLLCTAGASLCSSTGRALASTHRMSWQ